MKTKKLILAATLAATFTIGTAQAGLLVYEGFDGYKAGAVVVSGGSQTNVSSNAIGISGKWSSSGTSNNMTFSNTGLTFSNLETSGGSYVKGIAGRSLMAKLDESLSTFTGTLYTSYLVQVDGDTLTTNSNAGVGIKTNSSDSTTRQFYSWAGVPNSGTKSGVGYNESAGGTTTSTGSFLGSAPNKETTFIVISRFTNVGLALDTSNVGTATQWILSEAQFDYWKALDFADVDNAAQGTGEDQITGIVSTIMNSGTYNLEGSLDIQGSPYTTGVTITFDEIRFGTSFADVTPVPEPAQTATVLGLLAITALAMYRRRT